MALHGPGWNSHRAIVAALSIDQERIRYGLVPEAPSICVPGHHLRLRAVKPVSDEQQEFRSGLDGARMLIPLLVDDKAAKQAVAPLQLRVGMPPESTVLVLPDVELIGEGGTRWDGALGIADGAVHVVEALQTEAMPVQ